jgi:3-phenylpropionate/trans-cinnamate dioxygenase ferredoxin reductase subunit
MADPLVIIGAGQAASQLVASLAQDGFAGEVCLVGDEPHLPYQRPPLSKKFLAGELALDRLYVKPAAFYEKAGSRLLLGQRAERIDREGRAVILADGTRLPYSTLVLATGSRPRELPLPGAFCLRTIADVDVIRARLVPGKSLVVIGGGYIGLELAAVAVKLGVGVTVLEQAPRLMARGVGPVVSAFYARLPDEEGVTIRTGAVVRSLEGNGPIKRVVCDDAQYDADIVVIGAGAVPNVELAREAGLAVEDGIVVDAQCRTDDASIWAIGDCTSQHHDLVGRRLRLESVHNALEQARIAAAAIGGRKPPAIQVPWFWTDQYDVKMQMAGLSAGHDQAVVRGNPGTGRSFAVFYMREGTLIAVDAVNRAPEFMMSKQLIAERAKIDPARLGDESVAMKDMRN